MLNLKNINFKKIIIISIFIHILASIFSQGVYHPDEHFQVIEFALLKTGVNQPSDLAWEYDYKIRPSLQPAIVYAVIKSFHFFSIDNPFIIIAFLRFLSATVNFISILLLFLLFIKEIKYDSLKKWFVYLSFLLWPLIYIHVRFSSESLSGALFFTAMSLYLLKYKEKNKYRFSILFFSGILMGFSFLFRYQSGILILSFVSWLFFISKEKIKSLIIFSLGIIFVIGLGVFLDKWFYNVWTFSPWNYLYFNIVKNMSSSFGSYPWWYYFRDILFKAFPPFSLLLIFNFFIMIIFKPKNILTWIILPFFIIHSFISHKEIRFLFPLINIIPALFVLSIQEIFINKYLFRIKEFIEKYNWNWIKKLFWVMNILLLIIVTFKPSKANFYMYYYLYNSPYKKIYYMNLQNPYKVSNRFKSNPIAFNFYKPKGIELFKLNNISEIRKELSKNGYIIIITEERHFNFENLLKQNGFSYKILFRNIPQWAKALDINNWVERTKFLSIYNVYK